MHKAVNGGAPEYLADLLPDTVKNITSYDLRNKENFEFYEVHAVRKTNNIIVSWFPDCKRQWNSLDDTVRNMNS